MRQMNHNHNLFWFAWFCLYTTVKCARNVASSFLHLKKNALDLMDFKKKTNQPKKKESTCNSRQIILQASAVPIKADVFFFL